MQKKTHQQKIAILILFTIFIAISIYVLQNLLNERIAIEEPSSETIVKIKENLETESEDDIVPIMDQKETSKNNSIQEQQKKSETNLNSYNVATFAGGCFWCMEGPFEKELGVIEVVSGYAGGDEDTAIYKQVAAGKTNHVEAVQVYYDDSLISYVELLDIYWKQINPTDDKGQFADRGYQYSPAIFYRTEKEKEQIEQSKKELTDSKRFKDEIVVLITEHVSFYPAEEYHQDYYKKNPNHYKRYRKGSGREYFLKKNWQNNYEQFQKPSSENLKQKLSNIQYAVTQEDATETPFMNEYNSHKADGIYVDIVSGEPLFSSKDKYDSASGWPSFTKPIDTRFVTKLQDNSKGMTRIEVRSTYANSHLGHVFNDGPKPNKLRYCINSAALKFVSIENMEKEGYGNYLYLFS